MKIKKIISGIIITMLIMTGCGAASSEEETTTAEITTSESADGEITEVSELYIARDTELTYFRNATDQINIDYYLSQIISVEEGGELVDIDVNNFNIEQPTSSEITFDGGFVFGTAGEMIELTDGEIHIPNSQLSRLSTSNYDLRLNFSTGTIGSIPPTHAEFISFEESNIIFTNYMRNNSISSNDLKGTISFRIEITVLNSEGNEETCYRDFELVFIPGDFLMEPYIETGNIFTYNNRGSFLQ